MDIRHPNRRQVISALAGAAAVSLTGSRIAGAQTPVAVDANAFTTQTFAHDIAWSDPWTRDDSVSSTGETDVLAEDTDEVIETVTYDRVVLLHPDGAFGEMIFAPSPGDDERWEITYRWSQIDQYTSVESGSVADFWYELDFFVYEGAEYGRFVKGTYPEDGDHVSTIALTAPVATFGDGLQAYLDGVTLDGAPPFINVDPAGLQAVLDPLVGAGLSATPEASPTS